MPILTDYQEFEGLHWETGSIRNYYAYRDLKAPHTGEPYTEALLLGISGGIVMGYFSFAYEGYDPQAAILTRNTFDPIDRLLSRLGVVQDVTQTTKPDRAVQNLVGLLEEGTPVIAWADMFSLTYNALPFDEGMWGMLPLIVYGYDAEAKTVYVADRARTPLSVTTENFAAARGRVKKDKFRLMTLDMPDPDKLIPAVQRGIWDCIKLYTEAPPKGSKQNFGLAAYQRWAKLLTQPKQKQSWANVFAPGVNMHAGLTSAFDRIAIFGSDGVADAERGMYADFLDEAHMLLDKPVLKETATIIRQSAKAWQALGQALLPEEVPLLSTTRKLMIRRHQLFLEHGNEALPEIQQLNTQLDEQRNEAMDTFPLDDDAVTALCHTLKTHILTIHDIEQEAVKSLQAAMV